MKKPTKTAREYLPERFTLPALRKAAAVCKGCHLYKEATQTVFGEGKTKAKILVVGEIPGEKEDEAGKPFVGPAGKLLRETVAAAGIDWEDIYLTNVVKHFKFAYINQRKMHRSPNGAEVRACMPWLEAEMEVIQPQVILCLGSTAAKSLINKNFKIREQHGKWFHLNERNVLATFHPSAILRTIDHTSRHQMKNWFLKDLKKIAGLLQR